ncbi:MAG TPA: hypothetical protein VK864_12505 [Longimicrobiales bacterium]|nr:hypothetical protein [Longimicrobiales bacterium]
MSTRTICILAAPSALLLLAACTPNRPAAAPAPVRASTLRLVDFDPPLGATVDTATEVRATLAYDIPDFRSGAFWIMPAFVNKAGRPYYRGPPPSFELNARTGVITLRVPLRDVMRDTMHATPLTVFFQLMERSGLERGIRAEEPAVIRDTIIDGRRIRVGRALVQAARVGPTTRAIYYNGGGTVSRSASLLTMLEEYFTFRSHKAFALAQDSVRLWGYAYGYRTRAEAVERALQHCTSAVTRRQRTARCEIIAVDNQAVEPGDPLPADTTGTPQPGTLRSWLVRPRPVNVTGMAVVDSLSFDLDRDGSRERIELHARVERDSQGRLLWEDAHNWVLLVRDGADVYPLFNDLIPRGQLSFSVLLAAEGPVIVASQHAGSGQVLASFSFDAQRSGYAGRSLRVNGEVIYQSRAVR